SKEATKRLPVLLEPREVGVSFVFGHIVGVTRIPLPQEQILAYLDPADLLRRVCLQEVTQCLFGAGISGVIRVIKYAVPLPELRPSRQSLTVAKLGQRNLVVRNAAQAFARGVISEVNPATNGRISR